MDNNKQISDQDLAIWQKIMSTVKQITGFEAHIINLDGSEVTKALRGCALCALLRSTEEGNELCDNDNRENAKKAVDEGRPIQYLCHAKQVNYAIPIQIAGKKRICLIGEHVLSREPKPEEYREMARDIGIDFDILWEAVQKLPVKPGRENPENREIIENLLAKVEELIAMNEISRVISEIPWLPDRLNFILDKALDFLESSLGFIQLVDEDKNILKIVAERSLHGYSQKELKIGEGVLGWVAKNNEPLIINDVTKDKRYIECSSDVKSELAVPLRHSNKVIGVLNIGSEKLGAFQKRDRELLEAFAEQAAIAIRNSKMLEELQQRKRLEQIGFREIYDAISQKDGLDKVLDMIMRRSLEFLHFDYGSILLIKGNELVTRYSYNMTAQERAWRIPLGEGVTGSVAKSGKLLNIPDVRRESRFVEVEKGVLSELAVPLIFHGYVIGVFNINSTSLGAFSDEHERQLSLFADQAAIAIGIARLLEDWTHETTIAYRYIAFLRHLREINQSIIGKAGFEESLSLVAKAIADLLESEVCVIFLYDQSINKLVLKEAEGFPRQLIGIARFNLEEGSIGWVVSNCKSLNIEDATLDEKWFGRYTEKLGQNMPSHNIRAFICSPIFRSEPAFGAVAAINKKPSNGKKPVFDEEDQRILEVLCSQIAFAIEYTESRQRDYYKSDNGMSDLRNELRKKTDLLDINAVITSTLNLDEVLQAILEKACNLLEAKRGNLRLVDEKTNKLIYRATYGPDWTNEIKLIRYDIEKDKSIGSLVARTRRPHLSNNVLSDPDFYILFSDIKSHITVPLIFMDTVIGVLSVDSDKPDAFNQQHLEIMSVLGHQAAIAIENARLYTKTFALYEIGRILSQKLELQDILHELVQKVADILNGEACSLFLWDENRNSFVLRASLRLQNSIDKAEYHEGEGVTGWVAKHGESLLITTDDVDKLGDISPDLYWKGKYREFEDRSSIRGYLAAPIKHGGRTIGVIRLINKRNEVSFNSDDEDLLNSITGQICIAIQNAQLVDDLRRANAATADFIANFGHEMKNPLSQVKLYADLLKLGVKDDEERQRYLNIIDDEVNRYQGMIENLMYVATSESGKIDIVKKDFIFQDIVKRSIELHTLMASDKHIKMVQDLPELPIHIMGDARLIRQAIDNLIHNAIKYNSDCGLIEVKLINDKENAILTIRDTGPGIAEEDRPHIFDKFFRKNVKAVSEKGGTGLGLFIVKDIIEQHDGTIDFESKTGVGTTFRVVLPKQGRSI